MKPRPICDICCQHRWWKNIQIEYESHGEYGHEEIAYFICKFCVEKEEK